MEAQIVLAYCYLEIWQFLWFNYIQFKPSLSTKVICGHIPLMKKLVNYRIYPPKNKPPPPFSAVDMAHIGEGAYFRMCAKPLKYKPPSSRWRYLLGLLHLYNTYLAIYMVYTHIWALNTAGATISQWY